MHNSSEQGVCVVCRKPVDLSDAHWLHEDDCPQVTDPNAVCTCHRVAHPEHCPEDGCS